MREAGRVRQKLVKGIETGRGKKRVVMDREAACLVFGLSKNSLERMANSDRRLVIDSEEGLVTVDLVTGERTKKDIYRLLYGVVSSLPSGQAGNFLREMDAAGILAKEDRKLKKALEVLRVGRNSLSDEDVRYLHIKLAAYHSGIVDREGLPDWENALSANTF